MFYRTAITRKTLPLIVMLLLSSPRLSAAVVDTPIRDPYPVVISVVYEVDPLSPPVEPQIAAEAMAGYRFLSVSGNGNRAAEYDFNNSGPLIGAYVNYLGSDHKFFLEGDQRNHHDYRGSAGYDFKGHYRLNISSQSLYHNIDNELLDFAPFSLNGNAYTPVNNAFTRGYALSVTEDQARFRYKSGKFPMHVHLGYWRLTRNGNVPLRFADQAFEGRSNTIFAGSRAVDQKTHEGRFGFDTHLGLFDLIYDFRIRQFGEYEPTPRGLFSEQRGSSQVMQRFGGVLDHNSITDSRFYAHTVWIHTSLAGGVVGAASYTVAKQENLSGLTDFSGARRAYTISSNVAGDLSYTPAHDLSMSLKYRRQEVDRHAPASLESLSGLVANPPVAVRTPLDTVRDSVTATLLLRSLKFVTIKGEYKGELLSREHVSGWIQPGKIATINFPAHSATQSASLALLGKPLKGLKYSAQYGYTTVDHPAYADQYEEKHEANAQVSYHSPSNWGVLSRLRMAHENSDHLTIQTLDLFNPSQLYQMSRNKQSASGSLNLWVVPWTGLTVTGRYGLFHSSTDQGVLFASTVPGSIAATNYASQAQIYSLNSLYRWSEQVDLSLLLQQIRSYARFSPGSADPEQAAGVSDLTRVNRVESTMAARVDCRLSRNFSWGIEYSFRDYNDRNDYLRLYNGQVNSVQLNVAASW